MIRQQEMIQRVKAAAEKDERIDAVMMYGSFTQGSGDEYSDIEFYIFFDDKSDKALDTKQWIAAIHPIYTHFFNSYGTEVVIFTNLIRGEFHFIHHSEMHIINTFKSTGYFPNIDAMCLYDRQGRLKEALQMLSHYQADRQTPEIAAYLINSLLNELLLGLHVYKRGEYARSLESLHNARKYYLQSLRLLENKTEHWVNPTRNLEKELSAVAYDSYRAATAKLDTEELLGAYRNLLKHAKNTIAALGQRFTVDDFDELIDHIERYIQ